MLFFEQKILPLVKAMRLPTIASNIALTFGCLFSIAVCVFVLVWNENGGEGVVGATTEVVDGVDDLGHRRGRSD